MQAIPYVLTAFSAGAQVHGQRQVNKANDLRQRAADGQASTERRRIVREDRIRRANVINSAAQTGTQDSSSAVSAAGAIGNQTGFNLAQSFGTQSSSRAISARQQSASNSNTFASTANSGIRTAQLFQ